MEPNYLPDFVEEACDCWALVGSRIVCKPPPMDTDLDILVLVTENFCDISDELKANLWEYNEGYGEMEGDDFISYKKTVDGTLVNIILTDTKEWFDLFMEATAKCIENNYLSKVDRIACFDKIMAKHNKPPKTIKASPYYTELNFYTTPPPPILGWNSLHSDQLINF